MQKRYPHYMTPAKGGKWPKQVLCLVSSEGGRYSSMMLKLISEEYTVYCSESGSVFMESEIRYMPDWILDYRCGRTWTILDVWGAIERGEIILAADWLAYPNHREIAAKLARLDADDSTGAAQSASINRTEAAAQGYLVMEDTPNIMRFRWQGTRKWVTWVDVRNYDKSIDWSSLSDMQVAKNLRTWYLDYHKLCNECKLGSLQATAGSQALHGFRHGHYEGGIYVHSEPRREAYEQSAYYGGRCEAYRIGHAGNRLYYCDIRSSYPYICGTRPLPIRPRGPIHVGSEASASVRDSPINHVANVTITTDEAAYPYRLGKDIVWPIGTFDTVLCGPELEDAINHGRIVHIHSACGYVLQPCLRGYAERLYDMRRQMASEKNADMERVCKSLAVSIVGKFGQRSRLWQYCGRDKDNTRYSLEYGSDEHGEVCRYRTVGGVMHKEVSGDYTVDAVPCISAWITAYGRMALLRGIRAVGWDRVYYLDTDGIITDDYGVAALRHAGMMQADEWGMFTVKWGPSPLIVRGIKHYIHDGVIQCAGLPPGFIKDCGDGLHYSLTEPPNVDIMKGERPAAETRIISYAQSTAYRHGVVHADGKVSPIRLSR